MFSNTFNGIKIEFEGLYYGGNYDIEVFSDGRLYYSYIENNSIEIKRGAFQISKKGVMIYEEMMEYFEFLKNQRNYFVNEFTFGSGVLIVQKKNGREEKIRIGKEIMFEYSKILIDKYTPKSKQIFLMDTYLEGIKYIRNFNVKMKYTEKLDLFREFNGISLNSVAVFNQNREKVGYIPKNQSEILARLIDAGKKLEAISISFDEKVALKVYLID